MKARAIAVFLGSMALVSSVACSSSSTSSAPATFDCSTYGANKCTNDPAPTSAQTADCTSATADPNCGSAAASILSCENAPHTCDAQGVTDQTAVQAACSTQYAAYSACLMAHPNDAGETPSGVIASGYGNADEGQPPLAQCPVIGNGIGNGTGNGTGNETSADAGNVDFGSEACDQCMADACCSSTTTCAASSTCAASVTCIFACGDDSTCQSKCPTSASDTDAINAVLNCSNLGCTTDAGIGPCD